VNTFHFTSQVSGQGSERPFSEKADITDATGYPAINGNGSAYKCQISANAPSLPDTNTQQTRNIGARKAVRHGVKMG